MNIIITDLEANKSLDQEAMSSTLGGLCRRRRRRHLHLHGRHCHHHHHHGHHHGHHCHKKMGLVLL